MLAREQLDQWQKDGLITAQQKETLLATLPDQELERTIDRQARTVRGTALLFSSAMLSGAVIFLFKWLHDVPAPAHEIVLFWMLSTAPVVYVLRLTPIVTLFALLFFAWVGFFVYWELPSVLDVLDRVVLLPLPYLAGGVMLFAIGGTHYLAPRFAKIARIYRVISVQVVLLAVFALSMDTFSANPAGAADWRRFEASNWFLFSFLLLSLTAAGFTGLNMRLRRRCEAITRSEGPISLAMLALGLLYGLVPLPAVVYTVLFNLVSLALVGAVLYVGLQRDDLRLVRISSGGLLLLVLLRYADLSWSLLSLVPFLLGLLLVAGGGAVALVLLVKRVETRIAERSQSERGGEGATPEGAASGESQTPESTEEPTKTPPAEAPATSAATEATKGGADGGASSEEELRRKALETLAHLERDDG